MTFNISQFKSAGLVYGGARPALFQVKFPSTVQGIAGISADSLRKAPLVCRAAELPASQIGSVEVGYFGRKIKLAGDRTFGDWTVTVMNDEDFGIRSMMEKWSNAINRHISNVRDPTLITEELGYKADLDVEQFSKAGGLIRSYRIVGAYPTNISAIALDWDNQNQIETFQVTFAYDYWEPVQEQSAYVDGGENPYLDAANNPGNAVQ